MVKEIWNNKVLNQQRLHKLFQRKIHSDLLLNMLITGTSAIQDKSDTSFHMALIIVTDKIVCGNVIELN